MNKDKVFTGVLIEETTTFSFMEVCHKYHIPKELLMELVEYGLFNNQSTQIDQINLDQKSLKKMETAFRLHRDLDLNIPGVALVLDLLEEMEKMRKELEILHRHF